MAAGAVIYVCGNASTMAPGVRAALMDMYRAKTDGSDESADEWLAGLRDSRPLPGGHLGRDGVWTVNGLACQPSPKRVLLLASARRRSRPRH